MIAPNQNVAVADVYRAYLAFCQAAAQLGTPDLAHRLVLSGPLSVNGEAPMIAASIASAATLCIEPSPAAARHGERGGAIDFTVNNLDEALRALKNEVRKGLSIAICLEGDPEPVLAEMVDRGVQPDLLWNHNTGGMHAVFIERGARIIQPGQALLPALQMDTTWSVHELPGKWLPRVDEIVAGCLPSEDHVRKVWLKRAPRYLGRPMRNNRYLPMTAEEFQRIAEALEEEIEQSHWDGFQVEFKAENWEGTFGRQLRS